MNATTSSLLALWLEARTRFSKQLPSLQASDLSKKLGTAPNSLGFLIRHIAEVELLFAKNVFNDKSIKLSAETIKSHRDTGVWTDLPSLLAYADFAFEKLKAVVEIQTEENWSESITTQEFGTKTKAEALARIASHTAYHAGQMALIVKYGN